MNIDKLKKETLLSLFRRSYRMSPVKAGLNLLTLKLHRYFVPGVTTEKRGIVGDGAGPGFQASLNLRDRIQFMMFVRGQHEPPTEKAFSSLIRGARCFIDVGANIGYFSLLAASREPACKIFSFEPFPDNAVRFRENIKLNGFERIHLLEGAASDRSGSATLYCADPEVESGWNSLGKSHSETVQRQIPIQLLTVDDVLRSAQVETFDLMKIDVEGHELSVLRGSERVLTAPGKRAIIIEMNEPLLRREGTSSQEVDEYLKARGYLPHRISRFGKVRPVSGPNSQDREKNYVYLKA